MMASALRPRREERVGAFDVVIQIVERQVFLELQRVRVAAGQHVGVRVPKFMRRMRSEPAREHERDLGGFHGVFIHVEAEKLFGRNAAGRADFFKLPLVLREQFHQKILFQFAQRAVGDEQKVAAAARGVEHAEGAQLAEQFEQFGSIFGGGDAFLPRAHDGGADNFLDVGLVGEMRAEGMAFLLAETAFKERAEDDGLDFRPVFLGRFKEQANGGRLEFDRFDFGEESAVEIIHAGIASAARGLRVVHLPEEVPDQIVAGGHGVFGIATLLEAGW